MLSKPIKTSEFSKKDGKNECSSKLESDEALGSSLSSTSADLKIEQRDIYKRAKKAPLADEADNSNDKKRLKQVRPPPPPPPPPRERVFKQNTSADGFVFVENLPEGIVWHEIKDFMKLAGDVLYVDLGLNVEVHPPEPNLKCVGYAIVKFKTKEDAHNAIEKLDGILFRGRQLMVTPHHVEKRPTIELHLDLYRGRQVLVTNLGKNVGWQDLREVFIDCGIIDKSFVFRDSEGHSRQFGVVLFESPDSISRAIKYNGYELKGKKIKVEKDFNIEEIKRFLPTKYSNTKHSNHEANIEEDRSRFIDRSKFVSRLSNRVISEEDESSYTSYPKYYSHGSYESDHYPGMSRYHMPYPILGPYSNEFYPPQPVDSRHHRIHSIPHAPIEYFERPHKSAIGFTGSRLRTLYPVQPDPYYYGTYFDGEGYYGPHSGYYY